MNRILLTILILASFLNSRGQVRYSFTLTSEYFNEIFLYQSEMKANKSFEYFVIQGITHSDSEMYQYVFVENLIAKFFAKHLLTQKTY